MSLILGITGQRPYSVRPVEREFGKDKTFAGVRWYQLERDCGRVITGMADGVDLWAAAAAKLNGIPFTAALPFPGEVQSARWSEDAKANYWALLEVADQVWEAGPQFHMRYYGIRNQYIVDHSDEMLVVSNGSQRGGTWDCMRRVATANKPGVLIQTSRRSVTTFADGAGLADAFGVTLDRLLLAA